MFQAGVTVRRGDNEIDASLTGQAANLIGSLALGRVDILRRQGERKLARYFLEMPSHSATDLAIGDDERHHRQAGKGIIRPKHMHEMQLRAEVFDERERELNRARGIRGKIDRDQDVSDPERVASTLLDTNTTG
jgi:hypothetical protein